MSMLRQFERLNAIRDFLQGRLELYEARDCFGFDDFDTGQAMSSEIASPNSPKSSRASGGGAADTKTGDSSLHDNSNATLKIGRHQ
ncbi:hypothetical protein [Sinorhizobium americanum]|uniref:hypothetical protein n=1 Tax=Sinorhizobium americanum TaxID=194963 RepID=UPI0007D9865D|nr:hypothetical protein [Sinorhizobium americanum]OAP43176.1 hypothetical protein ATC00_00195 [Sinorhizobium americanum]